MIRVRPASVCLAVCAGLFWGAGVAADQAGTPFGTPLRGAILSPDPRMPSTLPEKGFPFTEDGIRRALVTDDQTALEAALTGVSALGLRGLLPQVERHLTGPAPVAIEAAVTLMELGDGPTRARGRAALVRALDDASWPDVQLNAAAYLARAKDPKGVPILTRALGSEVEAIRLQAVVLLPAFAGLKTGGVDQAAALEKVLLGRDPSALVRREAVRLAGGMADRARRAALLGKVAREDPDPAIKDAARRHLGGDAPPTTPTP